MVRSQASPVQAGRLYPGTELIVERRCYRHHGIYVGEGNVIHYAGWVRYRRGLVEEISIEDFAGRSPVRIGRAPAELDHGADIVGRARSRLGERCYDLLRNNCEHFCNWCQIGHSRSSQVEIFRRRFQWIGRAAGRLQTLSVAVSRGFSKTGWINQRKQTGAGRNSPGSHTDLKGIIYFPGRSDAARNI